MPLGDCTEQTVVNQNIDFRWAGVKLTLTIIGTNPQSRVSELSGPPLTDQQIFAVILPRYDTSRSLAYTDDPFR
jgi:hypothetical protein